MNAPTSRIVSVSLMLASKSRADFITRSRAYLSLRYIPDHGVLSVETRVAEVASETLGVVCSRWATKYNGTKLSI